VPRGEFRTAAVLVPLYVANGSVHVVLTQRTDNVRTHQGQVSFPGGGWEEQDATLRDTALREAHEEVGLDPDDVEVLGVLDDLPTAVSSFRIRPFVGVIPHPYEFVHQAMEVAYVFAPKLEIFADESRRRTDVRERDGQRFEIYYYDVDGAIVWGATARMLVRLIEVLRS
jgi:8-oxo-dGTP pyrophosphatase MutT (NUDIX family)